MDEQPSGWQPPELGLGDSAESPGRAAWFFVALPGLLGAFDAADIDFVKP